MLDIFHAAWVDFDKKFFLLTSERPIDFENHTTSYDDWISFSFIFSATASHI